MRAWAAGGDNMTGVRICSGGGGGVWRGDEVVVDPLSAPLCPHIKHSVHLVII